HLLWQKKNLTYCPALVDHYKKSDHVCRVQYVIPSPLAGEGEGEGRRRSRLNTELPAFILIPTFSRQGRRGKKTVHKRIDKQKARMPWIRKCLPGSCVVR